MKRFTAAVLMSTVLTAPCMYAEPAAAQAPGIRASIERVRFEDHQPRSYGLASRAAHKNSAASKASAGFVMGFLGMFAGGFVGAMVGAAVSPCHCHEPGLDGAMIGMPIGAAAGAVLGVWLASQ